MKKTILMAVLGLVMLPISGANGEMATSQSIRLKRGWNAVYIEVSPDATPDEVFRAWPVESVGIYDPAAFLATRQFASNWSSQGIPARSILMWQRDFPEVTQLAAIPAGVIAVTFNTNTTAAVTTVTLEGTPAAPRITWHKTDTNTVQNVFGLSLQQGASIRPWDYLEGFAGIGAASELYTLAGTDTSVPTLVAVETDDEYGDGAAFFATSTIQSDWSGVLNVSPMTGLDFGDSESRATLSIRNDGAAARTVAVDLATNLGGGGGMCRCSVHPYTSAMPPWRAPTPFGTPAHPLTPRA